MGSRRSLDGSGEGDKGELGEKVGDRRAKVPRLAGAMLAPVGGLSDSEVNMENNRERAKGRVLSRGKLQSAGDSDARSISSVDKGKRTARRTRVAMSGRSGDVTVGEVKAITSDLLATLCEEGLPKDMIRSVVDKIGMYEVLVMKLLVQNERLKGKMDVYEKLNVSGVSGGQREGISRPAEMLAPLGPAPKPVETWSVVVRSKNAESTPEDVVRKVVQEVGPALGVRVHDVKPVRGKGAVLRTPSVAERDRVARNQRFGEVGLVVDVNERVKPRVVVQRVHSEITPDEFMDELYVKNLRDVMSREDFGKSVKLVSPPWKGDEGGSVNVIVEGGDVAMGALMSVGRVYVKWFSFPLRGYEHIRGCFRCLSFDHRVSECRLNEDVCRRCGQQGHKVRDCENPLSCRNCAFKGRPSGHLMMSRACPIYCEVVARANSRH